MSTSAIEMFFSEWVHILFALCQVTRHTLLLMVSHYSTDQQVAVIHQDIRQCISKGREQEDCKLVHMDVSYAGFKILIYLLYKRFLGGKCIRHVC